MNTEIQRFDFKGAALRTLTDENDEPWFAILVSQCAQCRAFEVESLYFSVHLGSPSIRLLRCG